MANRVSQLVVERLVVNGGNTKARVTQFIVDRLVLLPKNGTASWTSSLAVSLSGTRLLGGVYTVSGRTDVGFTGSISPHLGTPVRFGQSGLGGPTLTNQGPGTHAFTRRLGLYPLSGGNGVGNYTGKYGTPFADGTTQAYFRWQVNGTTDPLTAKLRLNFSKLAAFSLGYNSVFRTTSTLASAQADGHTAVAFTATSTTTDGNWTKFPLKNLDAGRPNLITDIRKPGTEGVGGVYRTANIQLIRSNYGKGLTQVLNPKRIGLISTRQTGSTDYVRINVVNSVNAWEQVSSFTSSLNSSPASFTYSRSLTVAHASVPNPVGNFPVLVSGTFSWLATVANGGRLQSSSGFDIAFTLDSAGTKRLYYDLDYYNPTTGQIAVWVMLPTASSTVDSVFYIHYGSAAVTSSIANTSVWDPAYKSILHLGNGTTLSVADATANGFNATNVNTVVAGTGKINGCATFNGTTNYLTMNASLSALFAVGVSSTVQMWFKGSGSGVLLAYQNTAPGTTPTSWVPLIYIDSTGKMRTQWRGAVVTQVVSTATYNDNLWHFMVHTYDGTTQRLYVDGALIGSQAITVLTFAGTFYIGAGYTSLYTAGNSSTYYYGGSIDDVRFSSNVRDAAWIATEYNNQNSPGTFITAGSEVAGASVPIGQVIHNSTLLSFSYHVTKTAKLADGVINTTGFTCGGATTVLSNYSQVSISGITATASTAVGVVVANKISPGAFDWQGTTNVAPTAKRMVVGDWKADGVTDSFYTAIGGLEGGFECTGLTNFDPTGTRIGIGAWRGDGTINWSFAPYVLWAGAFSWAGATAVALTASQTYTSGVLLSITGATAVAVTPKQIYGNNALQWSGQTDVAAPNTHNKIAGGTIQIDGSTAQVSDAIADYFVRISSDGLTNFDFGTSLRPYVQISCVGVGDLFYQSIRRITASMSWAGSTAAQIQGVRIPTDISFNMSGITDVADAAVGRFSGFLIGPGSTGTAFTVAKTVNAFIKADGHITFRLDGASDQYATTIFNQIDQDMHAIGTFLYDGSTGPTTQTTLTLNSKHYVLAPDYVFGLFADVHTVNDSDFPAGVLTTFIGPFSNTSRANDNIVHGRMSRRLAFGPAAAVGSLFRKVWRDETFFEWVRVNFFVDSALDYTQNSDTLGFTASGQAAVAGYGPVGHEKDKYVTYSLFTSVRNTQTTLELLIDADPNVNVSQVCYEMIFLPTSAMRNTQTVLEIISVIDIAIVQQVAVESLGGNNVNEQSALLNQIGIETLASIKATAELTQATLEVLATGNPAARMSQTVLEILSFNSVPRQAVMGVNQIVIEALDSANPNLVSNQIVMEALHVAHTNATVNSLATETMHNNSRNACVNNLIMEGLHSSTRNMRVKGVCVEMLVRYEHDSASASLANNPHYHI